MQHWRFRLHGCACGGKIAVQSRELQFGWNAPLQMGITPPGMRQIAFNTPSEGDKYALQLEHGDVVVMFTDGITDNMFPNEIVAQVSTSATATEIADKIGMGALVLSNTARASPFAKKWAEHAKRRVPLESKPDDITVVVAKISHTAQK